jgi:hypothetical protein
MVRFLRFSMLFCVFLGTGAWAQDMPIKQRILMPGKVIQGHADIEARCNDCHASFEKEAMTSLCLDCHDDIDADRKSKQGFHGQSPLASNKPCNTCHTDHLGRDADIIEFQVDAFDHQWTRFPLEGSHVALACTSCHEEGEKYREAVPQCISCHKEDDFHKEALGTECEKCHQPQSWQKRLEFDHDTADFKLEGMHTKVACSGCHAGQVYEFEETTCVSCHKAIDVHAGKNGKKCDSCHSVDGWDKRVFDHSTTQFPLEFKHAELPCKACHVDGVVEENTSMECVSCHRNHDVHLGRNGKTCNTCHTTREWRKFSFDHTRETNFPLSGKHQELKCTQCHKGALEDPMPRDCASCHAADDIHKTPDMQLCATCHVTDNWNTINRFDHDFTRFPLVGLHKIVSCESCHVGNQFAGTEDQCVACHKADDHHKGALGEKCQSCHSPNAWTLWQFDHEESTGYPLLGSHKDLACDACHAPGSDPSKMLPICGKCHQRQDIHSGGFGQDCGRCHSQNKFFELILQDKKNDKAR